MFWDNLFKKKPPKDPIELAMWKLENEIAELDPTAENYVERLEKLTANLEKLQARNVLTPATIEKKRKHERFLGSAPIVASVVGLTGAAAELFLYVDALNGGKFVEKHGLNITDNIFKMFSKPPQNNLPKG